MDALNIGPLLLGSERLVFILGFAAMLIAAHLLGRGTQGALADWAWRAAAVGVVVARIGYVLLHLDAYSHEPLSVFYVWQGGFDAWSGLAGATLVTLHNLRGKPRLLGRAALSAGAGLVVALLAVAVLRPSAITGTDNEPMPAVTLYQLRDNAPVALAELAGTPTVINIWATWCPPCRREMPLLAETAASHSQVRFLFADQGEPAALVESFLATLPCELPGVLLDPQRALGDAIGVVGLPTTLFYDSAGRLVSRQVGELSRASLGDHLAGISSGVDAAARTPPATGGASLGATPQTPCRTE